MSDAMREAIARALSRAMENPEPFGFDRMLYLADAVLVVVRGVDADEAKALLRDAGRFMSHRDMCRWPEVCTCGLAEWREQLALYRRVVPVGTWSRDE